MAITYTALATTTVGAGGASSIDFASIPQTYTDLLIKISGRVTANSSPDFIEVSINSSLANFTSRRLQSDGAATATATFSNSYANIQTNNTTASTFGSMEIYFPNYTGSANKSMSVDTITENNGTTAYAAMWSWFWSQTAAITSIGLIQNFSQHSTATLYGIKNTI